VSSLRLMVMGLLVALFGAATASAATTPSGGVPSGKSLQLTPMSDAAAQGVGCLVLSVPTLAAAYALGPSEIMMLVTGAVIVPSTTPLLFITLSGILGAGACGIGAVATPSIQWLGERLSSGGGRTVAAKSASSDPGPAPPQGAEPLVQISDMTNQAMMSEDQIQGLGCVIGVLGLGGITLAAAPTEIVGLSAGGLVLPSKSSLLLLGIVGTVLPAGCTMGAAASLPLLALYDHVLTYAIREPLDALSGWLKGASSGSVASTEAGHAQSAGGAQPVSWVYEP
jgi:hypothetical protein